MTTRRLPLRKLPNMAETIIFRVKGLDKLNKRFGRSPAKLRMAIGSAIRKSSFLVEAESKKRAPVDTGRLRASIFTTLRPMSAIVEPKVKYAIYVHEGTRFMRPRPFMELALDDNKEKIERIFKQEIDRSL